MDAGGDAVDEVFGPYGDFFGVDAGRLAVEDDGVLVVGYSSGFSAEGGGLGWEFGDGVFVVTGFVGLDEFVYAGFVGVDLFVGDVRDRAIEGVGVVNGAMLGGCDVGWVAVHRGFGVVTFDEVGFLAVFDGALDFSLIVFGVGSGE